MSIAADEAIKASYATLNRELNGTSWLLGFERGYVAGRTAQPTDAEIKAAVRAMYYRHAADWESDEDYAFHLLDAARKAVSE